MVKGIEIGQEVVSVKLVEPEPEHVADTIVLTVAEAMSLDPPSPVFITVGSVISYKLRIIRLNAAQGNYGFINVQLGLKRKKKKNSSIGAKMSILYLHSNSVIKSFFFFANLELV